MPVGVKRVLLGSAVVAAIVAVGWFVVLPRLVTVNGPTVGLWSSTMSTLLMQLYDYAESHDGVLPYDARGPEYALFDALGEWTPHPERSYLEPTVPFTWDDAQEKAKNMKIEYLNEPNLRRTSRASAIVLVAPRQESWTGREVWFVGTDLSCVYAAVGVEGRWPFGADSIVGKEIAELPQLYGVAIGMHYDRLYDPIDEPASAEE